MFGWNRSGEDGGKGTDFEREALVHMDALYRSALYMTRSSEQAEDLVQETYLKAFRAFDRYKRGTNCRAWLFRILTNTFLNTKRRKIRDVAFLDEVDTDQATASPMQPGGAHRFNPEKALEFSDLSGTVKEALASVPADFRTAVVLADMQDFSYKEIAEIMECPVGTVMSRIGSMRTQSRKGSSRRRLRRTRRRRWTNIGRAETNRRGAVVELFGYRALCLRLPGRRVRGA
jgi:RNA polymerase sigma-70 factor (ECF subfamily)